MEISGLLNQTGQIAVRTTRDRHGQLTYAAAADVAMRFEQTNRTIQTPENEKEPIDAVVFVGPTVSVELGDKVIYNSVSYKVMRKSTVPGRDGSTHHLELLVQKWNV